MGRSGLAGAAEVASAATLKQVDDTALVGGWRTAPDSPLSLARFFLRYLKIGFGPLFLWLVMRQTMEGEFLPKLKKFISSIDSLPRVDGRALPLRVEWERVSVIMRISLRAHCREQGRTELESASEFLDRRDPLDR